MPGQRGAADGGYTLRVTGDDFGLTPGINAGILHAHRHGILTHASLMATAPFAREAMRRARETPTLAVGLHLVLADGRPCLPPRRIPTLVAPDGRFRPSAGAFVRDWVSALIDPAQVEQELRAQIEILLDAGFRPTHLDSHKHVHMWPPVFDIVARLARRLDIPAVRVAIERPVLGLTLENRADPSAFRQSIDNAMLAPCGWAARRALERLGLEPAWFTGRIHTGSFTPERLERSLRRIPPGTAEMMTHPGYLDEHLAAARTRLRAERERELAMLCAPETREVLRRLGVRLAGPPGQGAMRGQDGEERRVCCES